MAYDHRMLKELKPIIRRAKALRMTEYELRKEAGISATRYSRAKNGKSGERAVWSILDSLELTLNRLEGK